MFLGYADCGTGGTARRVHRSAAEHAITRLPGAHCYEFFAGSERFAALHEEEIGTFYLTDFLAKHFDALIWQGLGIDRHPELRDMYFGNYRRVVLLSQTDDPDVVEAGRAAAERLGLEFQHRAHRARAVRPADPARRSVRWRPDGRGEQEAQRGRDDLSGATSPPRSTASRAASATR